MGGVRYPRRFEIFRLEALGDRPYRSPKEAGAEYEAGRALTVIPERVPIAWSLFVSPRRYRFSLTFYAGSGTPLRTVTWEQVDGMLFCRSIVDLYYPDGDPGRRVPFIEVVSVRRRFWTDGVVETTLSSPIDADELRVDEGVPAGSLRREVPAFGDWEPLVTASAPASSESSRFGLDAIDEAIADARSAHPESRTTSDAGWRVMAGGDEVADAVEQTIAGSAVRIPVLDRGDVRLVPLMVQAGADARRDPREERARREALAGDVRDAFEHREGQLISLSLERSAASPYAEALRASGATEASYCASGPAHAVVLVRSGDADAGTLALALHIVPLTWVSGPAADVDGSEIDLQWSAGDVARA